MTIDGQEQRHDKQEETDSSSLEETLQSLPQLLSQRVKDLEERERALEKERLVLEKEKKDMGRNYKPSDVLQLNVGGDTSLAVLRRTLTAVEGSMLASRFSGRWDDSLEKDRDGNFFIDQPVELFRPMLDYLRHRACETPLADDPVESPNMMIFGNDERKYKEFIRMVEYYGMTSGIYPIQVELFNGKESSTVISGTGVTAKDWSTFVLRPHGHTRRIVSFEITLGEQVENFQVGWVSEECLDATEGGVAEQEGSLVLDLARSRIVHGDGSTPVDGVSARRGTIIRCCGVPSEKPRWFVNGKEFFYLGTLVVSRQPVAAFSAKGEFEITTVELSRNG